MYVNPFVAGILTTILIECVVLITWTIYMNTKGEE
jgi:hypothetical protein